MTHEKHKHREIGPYRLIEQIGHGGMGIVYIAEHRETLQRVALKTIKLLGERHLQGFRREIHALARIRHTGVVTILDQGIEQGIPWYAMEFISGLTLRQWARGVTMGDTVNDDCFQPEPTPTQETSPCGARPGSPAALEREDHRSEDQITQFMSDAETTSSQDLKDALAIRKDFSPGLTPRESSYTLKTIVSDRPPGKKINLDAETIVQPPIDLVIDMVRQICQPLAYLHGEGIIHRDLKPDNIIIRSDGSPVILDLGLMHRFGGEMTRETLVGGMDRSGTLAYMAPEQILGQFVDARADLYALGCILFELLTGLRPFTGQSTEEIIHNQLFHIPALPSSLRPTIPRALDNLIMSLLEKDPQNRIGFASDVVATLNGVGKPLAVKIPEISSRTYLYRPRFAGRENEFNLMKNWLDLTKNGQGCLIMITGESGMGKTRLMMELSREAEGRGFSVIASACIDGEVRALEAFRGLFHTIADHCLIGGEDVTDRLLGQRGKVLAAYEPMLKRLPGLSKYPEPANLKQEPARLRLFSYLADTMKALVDIKPTLMLIDDLHWADELSIGFLQFIESVPDFFRFPLIIVGTCRAEEIDEQLEQLLLQRAIRRVPVGRLSERAVSGILSDMLALNHSPELFSRFLANHTEGNPLFLAEILRSAIDEGILWRDAHGRWQIGRERDRFTVVSDFEKLPFPGNLHNLIIRRLKGLDSVTRSIMDATAVLGRETPVTIIQSMTGLDDGDFFGGLSELFRRQILEEHNPSEVRFTHANLREITHEALPPEELPAYHRKAAEILTAIFPGTPPEWAANLGYHWELAGERIRARNAYLIAAKSARDQALLLEATRLFRKSHQLYSEVSEDSIMIRIDIAVLLHTQGKNTEAEQELRKAIAESQRSKNLPSAMKALNHLAVIYTRTGKVSSAHRILSYVLDFYREMDDESNAIKIIVNLANVELTMGQMDIAQSRYEKALELTREHGDKELERSILGNLANTLMMRGKAQDALPLFEEALAMARQAKDRGNEAWLLGNLATVYLLSGKLERAGELFEEALRLQQLIGDRRIEGFILGNLAITEYNQGNLYSAAERYRHALTVFREIGDRRSEGIALGNSAEIALERKNQAEAESMLDRAIAIQQELGDQLSMSHSMILLGKIRFVSGHPDQAERLIRDALEITRTLKDKVFEGIAMSYLATITRLGHNDLHAARQLVDTAIAILGELNQSIQLGLALAERGHIDLAEGSSALSTVETLRELLHTVGASVRSELGQSLSRLERADNLARNNHHSALFRGQAFEDLPAFLSNSASETTRRTQ